MKVLSQNCPKRNWVIVDEILKNRAILIHEPLLLVEHITLIVYILFNKKNIAQHNIPTCGLYRQLTD